MALVDVAVFAPTPSSVRDARQFVAALLKDCPDASIELATLLVSELVSNAVRHARTAFSVAVIHEGATITIEVNDHSDKEPLLREPDASGGRGLPIVVAASQEWGVRTSPEGKVVFARLHC